MRRLGWGLFLLGSILVASARAEDLESKARHATALYERHRDGSDWRNLRDREAALRRLGTLDTTTARQTLSEVIRYRRPLGDQLVALRAIGPILDARTAAEVAKTVGRNPTPIFVETLADALARIAREDARAWLVAEGLRQSRPELLFACVEALGTLRAPEASGRLTEIYAATEGTRRRIHLAYAAVRALGLIDEPSSRPLLRKAAAHRDPRVRLAAADVLPHQSQLEDEDLALLKALLKDEDAVVVRAAAVAIGAAGLEALVHDVAWLLDADRLRTRFVAHEALVEIVGKDLGWIAGPWQRWARHQEGAAPPSEGERRYDFGTYYGFDLLTDRVVFVVDISGSMTWPWRDRHPKRFVAAKQELARTLQALAPATLFNVYAFNDKVKPWKKGVQKAEPKTVQAGVTWVRETFDRPGGQTNTYGVLERAFGENPEADTLYLLSDGAPNGGDHDSPEAILASVKHWNRFRRTAVNTIALTLANLDRGQPPLGQDVERMARLMRDLAEVTGGRYELVEDVPAWMREE